MCENFPQIPPSRPSFVWSAWHPARLGFNRWYGNYQRVFSWLARTCEVSCPRLSQAIISNTQLFFHCLPNLSMISSRLLPLGWFWSTVCRELSRSAVMCLVLHQPLLILPSSCEPAGVFFFLAAGAIPPLTQFRRNVTKVVNDFLCAVRLTSSEPYR